MRIKVRGDPDRWLFGKLYARTHLRADRWYKFGRELLYGRLEDEKPFHTVRRLVQQEDYMLHKMHLAGLPTPRPYGFAELTPEREYLLVTEFFDGAVELGQADIDDSVIDDGLALVRKLWDAGLAHRDIKPANLLVRDSHLLLIDVFFAEVHPTPWRQAVDLANMMLCLALRSDPQRVYQRALRQFSVAEISEAFAAARGLALPSQLRRMLRDQGRDLHAEFLNQLPARPQPIRIQRWGARRVGLLLLMVPSAILLVLIVQFVLVNNDRTLTPLNVEQPGLRRVGAVVAGGPVGAVGLAGALRALDASRMGVRRRQRQERLVEVHPQRRGHTPGLGRTADRRLRLRRGGREALRPARGTTLRTGRAWPFGARHHVVPRLRGRLRHRPVPLGQRCRRRARQPGVNGHRLRHPTRAPTRTRPAVERATPTRPGHDRLTSTSTIDRSAPSSNEH